MHMETWHLHWAPNLGYDENLFFPATLQFYELPLESTYQENLACRVILPSQAPTSIIPLWFPIILLASNQVLNVSTVFPLLAGRTVLIPV